MFRGTKKTHIFSFSDKVYYIIDTVKPLIDVRTEKVQSQSYAPYVFTSYEGIHSDATCFFKCVTFLDSQTESPNHCDFYLRIFTHTNVCYLGHFATTTPINMTSLGLQSVYVYKCKLKQEHH